MRPVTLDGERMVVRELADSDAPAVHKWAGDRDTVRWVPLGPLDRPGTVQYVAQLITQAQRVPRLGYTLAIERRSDHALLGTVSVEIDSFEHKRAELGYILRRDAWGQGYATEAAGLLVKWLQRQGSIVRIGATTDADNSASAAVLQKVGLQREGLMRRATVRPNIGPAPRDTALFASVKPEGTPP